MREDEADATLLAEPSRALHSDPHDFAGLYIRHRTAFTLHARRYLSDARDADEVVQEAFLRLFLALPELETELQALAYCRRTITNLCIDRYRAQARRPSLVDLGSIPLEELPDEDHGDPVVRAEDAALVREALSMLSPLHRAALVKREIEEKPLPVIAEELEVPEQRVKHLLFRARRALRTRLLGTSLEPGADGDGRPGLLARTGSSGAAAFLLLLLLGLGTGPDLQSIPVVGVDLPEIIPVTRVAQTVGEAVTDVVDAVAPDGAPPGRAADAGGDSDAAPQVAGDPSSSPTAAGPSERRATAGPAPAAAVPAGEAGAPPADQAPAADIPQSTPSEAPSASLPASQEPPPTGEPVPSAGPSPSGAPDPEPPSPEPTPSPASSEPAPSSEPTPSPSSSSSPTPSPSSQPSSEPTTSPSSSEPTPSEPSSEPTTLPPGAPLSSSGHLVQGTPMR